MKAVSGGSVPRGTLPLLVLGAAFCGTLLAGEVVHAVAARWSTRALGSGAACKGSHRGTPHDHDQPTAAVVAMGFADAGPRPNAVNRWRARIAVRTARELERGGTTVTIVCCGGPVRGLIPEARLLAISARAQGWTGGVLCEDASTSTWENVMLARPLITAADRIAFCSNGLHALKAREYLLRQDPALARRLIPAHEYRFGEMMLYSRSSLRSASGS